MGGHNGRVRRLNPLFVVVALAVGCGVDGPRRDVRVVSDDELTGADTGNEAPRAPAPGGGADGGADAGDVIAGVDPGGDQGADDLRTPGREDRPGSFGALRMPDTVAVVGDSLTVAATEEITAALSGAGVRTVIVDGRESRRMATDAAGLPSGVAAIEEILVRMEPDLWVVALGTNDVAAEVADDRFVLDLRATLTAVPVDVPLVWVDVWIRDRLDDVVAANDLLRGELDRRVAPTTIVDWFASATADGLITGDGVHLTQAGQDRFAAVIAEAVVGLGASSG